MSVLLNKIEMKLGTKAINLPSDIAKNTWGDPETGPISLMTIPDFSHLYPAKITVSLDNAAKKGRYYILDECVGISEGTKIIGVRDVNWEGYENNASNVLNQGYGMYSLYQDNYSVEDMMMQGAVNNLMSAFSTANSIFVDFKEPNLICLKSVTGADISRYAVQYPVDIFIEHPLNLSTIPVSQMYWFTKLALCDVASYLYEYLKYYDGIQTLFADVDLKLDSIKSIADERESVYQTLDDQHVSAANANQPLMFTI